MMIAILLVVCLLNLALSVAIAGTLVKLVKSEEVPSAEENLVDLSRGPYYRLENGELVQTGQPTYDMEVLKGKADPHSDGLITRPSSRNWDGISQRN
jgi:hypothetical protein